MTAFLLLPHKVERATQPLHCAQALFLPLNDYVAYINSLPILLLFRLGLSIVSSLLLLLLITS